MTTQFRGTLLSSNLPTTDPKFAIAVEICEAHGLQPAMVRQIVSTDDGITFTLVDGGIITHRHEA